MNGLHKGRRLALRTMCLALSLMMLIPALALAKPLKVGKKLIEYDVLNHYLVRGKTITVNARTDIGTELIRLVSVKKVKHRGKTNVTETEALIFSGGEPDDEGKYRLWKLEIPSEDKAGVYIYALYPGKGSEDDPSWGNERAEFTVRTYAPMSIISGHAKPKKVEPGKKTTIQFKTTSDVTYVQLIDHKKRLTTFKLPDKKSKAKKVKKNQPKITTSKRDGYILWTIKYPTKASFKPSKKFSLRAGKDKKLGKAFKLPMEFAVTATPTPAPAPTYEVAAASKRLSDMPVGLDISITATLALDADWQLSGHKGFSPDARLLEVARSMAADYSFAGEAAMSRELTRRLSNSGIKLSGSGLIRYERFAADMSPGDIAMAMRRKHQMLLENGSYTGAVVGVAEVVGGYDAFLLAFSGVEVSPSPTPLLR